MKLSTLFSKAKNSILKGKERVRNVKITNSAGEEAVGTIIGIVKGVATSILSVVFGPTVIIAAVIIFIVVAFSMITSIPFIVFGVDLGGGPAFDDSMYCNQDPAKAEYAYEPLQGGLAIPHYRQGDPRWGSQSMWDYDYKKWMTFEQVGCAYSSFAMIASYLLDQKIYPNDVARRLNASESNDTESWVDYFGPISEMYGIKRPSHTSSWDDMKEAIKNHQPVIAWYSGESGIFTHTGHFIVVRGMTSDGKYLVNDPSDNTPGYKEKYINRHFTEEEMRKAFGWGVIFEAKVCDNVLNVDYLQWAIDIANDDSHGYSQCSRNGPDYDCSSLVYYSLINSGYTQAQLGSSPFATYTMDSILISNGFEKYAYNEGEIQEGDILWRVGHTGIYAGNGQVVEALGSGEGNGLCGATGDQSGNEILVNSNYGNWSYYYRKVS